MKNQLISASHLKRKAIQPWPKRNLSTVPWYSTIKVYLNCMDNMVSTQI